MYETSKLVRVGSEFVLDTLDKVIYRIQDTESRSEDVDLIPYFKVELSNNNTTLLVTEIKGSKQELSLGTLRKVQEILVRNEKATAPKIDGLVAFERNIE